MARGATCSSQRAGTISTSQQSRPVFFGHRFSRINADHKISVHPRVSVAVLLLFDCGVAADDDGHVVGTAGAQSEVNQTLAGGLCAWSFA